MREDFVSNKQITEKIPYAQSKVESEYNRIVGLCANNGYVNVKLVSLDARHYASTDNVSIVFVFNLGKRFTFGTISVEQDTTSQHYLDSTIVLEHLDFASGEIYGEQKKIESERNLNRLGVFEAAKIENAIPTSSSDVSQIPIRVLVRTRTLQELTPEIGINDENNAFNVLLGVGYNHRNFFGGARNFSFNPRLNIQSLQFGTIFKKSALRDSSLVYKAEVTMQVVQPYFINNKTSISVAFSAMLANTFLSTFVRIQDDRGHTTVSSGPYRFVRHPMYAGSLFMFWGIPLLLGSWWALIASGLNMIVLVVRTALEDRMLQAELPGYQEYAQKFRYRLFPGIW